MSASSLTRSSPPGGPHSLPPGHPLMVPPHSTAGPLPAPSNHGQQQQQQSSQQHPHHPPTSINGGGPPSSYSGAQHAHPPPPPPSSSSGGSTPSTGPPPGAPSPMQSSIQSLISIADTNLPVVSNSPRGSPPTGGPTAAAAQLSRTPSRGSQHSPSSSGIYYITLFYNKMKDKIIVMD